MLLFYASLFFVGITRLIIFPVLAIHYFLYTKVKMYYSIHWDCSQLKVVVAINL